MHWTHRGRLDDLLVFCYSNKPINKSIGEVIPKAVEQLKKDKAKNDPFLNELKDDINATQITIEKYVIFSEISSPTLGRILSIYLLFILIAESIIISIYLDGGFLNLFFDTRHSLLTNYGLFPALLTSVLCVILFTYYCIIKHAPSWDNWVIKIFNIMTDPSNAFSALAALFCISHAIIVRATGGIDSVFFTFFATVVVLVISTPRTNTIGNLFSIAVILLFAFLSLGWIDSGITDNFGFSENSIKMQQLHFMQKITNIAKVDMWMTMLGFTSAISLSIILRWLNTKTLNNKNLWS